MQNIQSNKGSTLIEIIVVITIITILLNVFNSFYRVSKNNQLKRDELNQLFNINQFLNQKIEDNYFVDSLLFKYDHIDTTFIPDRGELTTVYNYVPYLKFVILDGKKNSLLNLDGIDLLNEPLSLGMQKCFFIFDMHGSTISGENYKSICDSDSILSTQKDFNIQGFIAYKSNNKINEINFFDWQYKNGFFGYYFDIFSNNSLIYNEGGLISNDFYSFDLLQNSVDELFNNNIFIVGLKDQNNTFLKGLYYGNENTLGNILKDEYVIKYLNSGVNSLNDNIKHIDNIFNVTGFNILYNISREEDYNGIMDLLFFGS